jgi:hypothetical protein
MSNVPTQANGKVLPDVAQLQAQIADLQAKLAGRTISKLAIKIANKGGVSVYGLQRFPITLYREQWERLFGVLDQLREVVAKAPTKKELEDRAAATAR